MSAPPPGVAPAPRGLLADVRAAIVGEPRDYTRGPIGRAILVLAIPMVLEMSMQSLFGVVDVYFVGRLGSEAVAVVGITDSLLSLVFAVGIGLAMGATAMVARRIGEGDREAAAEATVQAIALGVAISVPIAVVGLLFSAELLTMMGAAPDLAAYGADFTAIILTTSATVLLLFLVNAAFRGAGDPVVAMRALWIANLVNIALDPILIFGWGPVPAMGLEGAAVATAVGRGLGVAYQLYRLSDGSGHLQVVWRQTRVVPAVMARLARVSGVGVLQYTISTASFLAMMRILAVFGGQALAGYTIAVRVIIFVLLPAWGLGNAAATLVGQNLGAGQPRRAERSVWLAAAANSVFLGLVSALFFLAAGPIVAIFTSEPVAAGIAADCLRIISLSYLFWGFGMISVMAFNGAGDTTTPTWINFWVFWVFQIPLAWVLAVPVGLGPTGVFVAIALSQGMMALVGVLLFRRGTWKGREI